MDGGIKDISGGHQKHSHFLHTEEGIAEVLHCALNRKGIR